MRWLLGVLALLLAVPSDAAPPRVLDPADFAPGVYAIDQRFGSIHFSVDHLGLFKSEGQFASFTANLIVDPAHNERAAIDVGIDAGSVQMDSAEALGMLRSPDYFDVHAHPRIHFRSTAMEVVADHYTIHGDLELRGVTRPMVLTAVLEGPPETNGKVTTADVVVSGQLDRTAFGMTADRNFISDTVALDIRVRVVLARAAPKP